MKSKIYLSLSLAASLLLPNIFSYAALPTSGYAPNIAGSLVSYTLLCRCNQQPQNSICGDAPNSGACGINVTCTQMCSTVCAKPQCLKDTTNYLNPNPGPYCNTNNQAISYYNNLPQNQHPILVPSGGC